MKRLRLAAIAVVFGALLWVSDGAAVTLAPPTSCSQFSEGFVTNNLAASGDFTGDGITDVVVGDRVDGGVATLFGTQAGCLTQGPVTVLNLPWAVSTAADFNGDGKLDVAVSAGNSVRTSSLNVLLGNGKGGFAQASGSPYPTDQSTAATAVAVGDFNGDGKPDIVGAYIASSIWVMLGNGDGTFTPAPGSPFTGPSAYVSSIAVGDFNGDANLDVALAINGQSEVYLFLGDGHGGLTAAAGSPFATGGGVVPSSLTAADFNHDGITDLAVTGQSASSQDDFSVLLGNSNGQLSLAPGSPASVCPIPGTVSPTQFGCGGAVVGNFNGDGKPDLAVVLGFSQCDGARVLLGNGDGSFTPSSVVGSTGNSFAPCPAVAGDFNHDGKPDVAIVGNYSVDVLLNSPPDTVLDDFPPGSTRSTSAAFSFHSDDGSATFECQLDGAAYAPCASPVTYTGLSAGTHVFKARATNDLGLTDPTPAADTWTVDLSTPPAPSVGVEGGGPVVVGQPVTLVADGGELPGGTITDYQWDLGTGSFDHDTGTAHSIQTTFSTIGDVTVRVKVTDNLGLSGIGSATIPVVRQGGVGVSINNGDYATDNPAVQLDLVWPSDATQAEISNDGGFGPAGGTKTVDVNPAVSWTLASPSSERLPKTVYLRFPDSSNPTQTYTDDIILDTTTPVVQSASSAGSGGAIGHAPAVPSAGRVYKVRLMATEERSGISEAAFSAVKRGGTTVVLRSPKRRGVRKLNGIVGVNMASKPHWVRVRSAAGKWSKWHRIR